MLNRLEKNDNERIEKVGTKHETSMKAMEHSLKNTLETIEIKTHDEMADLKNQISLNISHIRQNQVAQIKSYQETSQIELKKLGEHTKSLDMISDSVRNMVTLSEQCNKILEAVSLYPVHSCRNMRKQSGQYMIQIAENADPFKVLCEQAKFDGGWTVIQHRFDGSVDFYRGWSEYRYGFGNLDGEFWLGLEYVHQLTKNRPHELLVEIKDFHGSYGYAKYDEFEIGSETEEYELKKLGTYSGTAGHSLVDNKGKKFSTFDRDNDLSGHNCAADLHGAWWYWSCTYTNLNGRYQNTTNEWSALTWSGFKDDWRGMSYSRMMIRDIVN
ncbi:hypothetical protein ZHAS_00005927 [Anopheles sinensis]|uniref:Fibrinogen C-terminal domain-containing protein n=1 Tax=Anopheles sinensis TaxID=74873 RepID=A0A084VKM5_ANOSI|nr:hypothetical protein ZHAS_00005927 [Anopheles sinensis]